MENTGGYMLETYRQGDVLLRRVSQLPDGAVKSPKTDRIVLAYGEVTGHAHAIATEEADL